ncbi:lipid phosphate phosphatase epsilon 1, chloroplastic isoform X2 [Malania oleifera]|uniref:lipid phosphate phosphatase epsilon 1, chloroplastic isoform X2 n=1 Tax=Malania oleifera TaxID=397392 RepID=UPI0025ADC9FA|nr:lipid phosphate phosphatase epsilon 1, chloroplastic isoform X2 [Malania oleifera]
MLASSAISHLTFTFRPEITLYRRLKSLKSIAFPHFQASSSVFSASKRHGILIGPSIMTEVISPSFSGSSRGHEGISAFEQEHLIDESSELRSAFTCDQLESTLNRLSKWLVTGLLGVVILWRHDAEALWAAMGSVINSGLSVILKRILNQERPVSTLRSDPGMPSSHAQSIFFSALFASMSVVEWLGMNALSLTLSALVLIFGSYLLKLLLVEHQRWIIGWAEISRELGHAHD